MFCERIEFFYVNAMYNAIIIDANWNFPTYFVAWWGAHVIHQQQFRIEKELIQKLNIDLLFFSKQTNEPHI